MKKLNKIIADTINAQPKRETTKQGKPAITTAQGHLAFAKCWKAIKEAQPANIQKAMTELETAFYSCEEFKSLNESYWKPFDMIINGPKITTKKEAKEKAKAELKAELEKARANKDWEAFDKIYQKLETI